MAQFPQSPIKQASTLQPWEHNAFDGTPFYDEELEVAQNTAHRIMAHETGTVLASVAQEAGLLFLSDEPIWFKHPETDQQKVFYGDCVFARGDADHMRITAGDLLLVIEIVSTHYRKKEIKDTGFQRTLNEFNEVPEFALVFPDASDSRSIRWHRLVDGRYEEISLSPGAEVASSTIEGLVLRVRPQPEWTDGRKIDVFYKGERRLVLDEERARAKQEASRAKQEASRAEQEASRAEHEKARAEHEKARAEHEKARAERLAARLRELGFDPDDQM
jgi:Uma2 family endonuclease